tara:strand:- start:58 stop:402 length:345 start_codon:yes stop_codon:yes gene_type:complete
MKDINKILEICKSNNVNLHATFNEGLFTSTGNSETENIVFAEIVLAAVDIRNDHLSEPSILCDDWWDLVLYFRPLAQLFAKVNDVAVVEWNGGLESCVIDFIRYKRDSGTLEVE